MKILLIDIDSKIQNLALHKIAKYYSDCDVIWNDKRFIESADKIFVSCIFPENKHIAKRFEKYNAVIGGSGYNLNIKLQTEIEYIKPQINIDFATRGCIRNCNFCIVPQKEGFIRADRDIYDIWDGKSKDITLLDNNILALPEHFKLIINQVKKHDLRIDFNQGLDIRLINDEIAYLLSTVRTKEIRFALDHVNLIDLVKSKLQILKTYLPNKYFFFYVLVYANQSIDNDLERLNFLRSENCRAYVQSFNNEHLPFQKMLMRSWANQRWHFAKKTYNEYLSFYQKYRPGGKINNYIVNPQQFSLYSDSV